MSSRGDTTSRQIFGLLMTFVAVAELLSFRKAADSQGKSQPAVTAQINQLEEVLGVKLFIRTTRTVRLTSSGHAMNARAKKLISDTGRLISDIQAQDEVPAGRVVASFSPTIAVSLIPRALEAFETKFPRIRVLLREELGSEMFAAVQTGAADFGIGPYIRVPRSLSFEPVLRQEFFLVLPKSDPIAKRGYATIEDLEANNLLCSAVGTTAREVLDQAALSHGVFLRPQYEALQYPTLFALAAAGFGACVMPKVSVDLLDTLALASVPFKDRPLSRPIGIITRHDEEILPAAKAFIDLLLQTAKASHDIAGLKDWKDA